MSDGWVDASFVLPAGSNQIRFSYYTDEAVNGTGWFIDDVTAGAVSDDFESGSDGWTLGGWEHTTGLFANNWTAAYMTPVYDASMYSGYQYGYVDDGVSVDGLEILQGSVDTSQLNRGEAVVVIANRPGENPFATGYTLLVDKGDAPKL
jgi:hypothetical protein